MARAGARYTNDAPWMRGNLVPKKQCSSVDIPDTRSILEITLAVSLCTQILYPSEQLDSAPEANNIKRAFTFRTA